MLEGYENRGDRSLVSLGQMLREILQEVDFVGDLGCAEISQHQRWVTVGRIKEHVRTMTFVLISAVMTESLLIRSLGDRFGSR